MERGWKVGIIDYYNKLKLQFMRMQVEYCAEKNALKIKKLNGITKVKEEPVRHRIFYSASDEGEESSSEDESENGNKEESSSISSEEQCMPLCPTDDDSSSDNATNASDKESKRASENDKGEENVSEDAKDVDVSDGAERNKVSEESSEAKEVGEDSNQANEISEDVAEDASEEKDSDDEFTDKVKSLAKKPENLLDEIKNDLLSDLKKDLGIKETKDDSRSNEDDVNTEKFLNNSEESSTAKKNNPTEDVDLFENDSKEGSDSETELNGAASQDIFDDNKNEDESSSDDSKSHSQSQSLMIGSKDKEYLKALETKKNVLASSDDSGDESRSDEDTAKTRISETSDSEKSSDSESISDVDSKGGSRKSKKTEGEKRRRISSSDRSTAKEDKELNRLMNLNNLKRRRLNFGSEEEGDKEKPKDEPKKTEKKTKKPSETLLDMYESDVSNEVKEEEIEPQEERLDPIKNLYKETQPVIKSIVLASSDSSSEESAEEEKVVEVKNEDIKPSTDKKKCEQKKRPAWMNDRLLHSEPSSSEDERRWKEKRKKKESSPEVQIISSDDSDDFRPTNIQKKKKRKKHSEYEITDVSSTESEVEKVSPIKSQESTPGKGRKNIKKILRKDSLMLETRQALKAETERKKRLEERKKVYHKLFSNNEKQLVLDFDSESKKPLLKVDEKLVEQLKPHQKEGVQFMWDCCFETLKRLEEDNGSGCILAHCMGLGKTLQAIALVHTLLNNDTGVQTILIVCPLNTVSNWQNEFKIWLKDVKGKKIRTFGVNQHNKHFQRSEELNCWQRDGGVMIISYEMFRVLTSDAKKSPIKKHLPCYEKALLDPGPDLVICDEGHKIKNIDTALSKSMRKIKTFRRVILTGTPLQNNLHEYYWMVNFIKPNILGNKNEFMNRFVNPISNGQFKDSTALDVKIMKKRSHVLHSLLDGCIQRINYDVASPFLPEKHEYVISIRLTPTQAKLYEFYLQNYSKRNVEKLTSAGLFKDFHSFLRVYTHPYVLRSYARKPNEQEANPEVFSERTIPSDWWKNMIPEEEFESPDASGKIRLLFSILEECKKIDDKLLVFSQSLFALESIEFFLKKFNDAGVDTWVENLDYFKLTGSTSLQNRTVACKQFNKVGNRRGRLFLISTKAGGLGINLIAANRVILFDASWNPSHDVQSIFRVYRFGQEKTCYIYRFLAEATMEEKIYERQITKLSLSDRVVDEHQTERHYTMGNLSELYTYEPIPPESWETPDLPKDKLFANILAHHKDIIVGYHEHDSLLENKQEEELTEEERQAAWEEFEKEKYSYENKGPEVLATNEYTNGVLNMMEILKNPASNLRSSSSSTVVNPFAQAPPELSTSIPNSSSSAASSNLLASALAQSSNPTLTRLQQMAKQQVNASDGTENPSDDILNIETMKEIQRIKKSTDNLMRLGRILNLYPNENERIDSFRARVARRARQMNLSFLAKDTYCQSLINF